MFDCYHCGDHHHVNDFCAIGPMAPRDPDAPGGWLIKADGGGWEWTGVRIAAVAALTEGRKVYDVTKGQMA